MALKSKGEKDPYVDYSKKSIARKPYKKPSYYKSSAMRKHEIEMKLLDCYMADPDLFWKACLLGGGAMAALGAVLGMTADDVKKASGATVIGKGFSIGGTVIFAEGIGLTLFSALMLLIPRAFGPDGIQAKISGGGFGFSAEGEIG